MFFRSQVADGEKKKRRAEKNLEFHWEALSIPLPEDDSYVFAHLLDTAYGSPSLAGTTPRYSVLIFFDTPMLPALYSILTRLGTPFSPRLGTPFSHPSVL